MSIKEKFAKNIFKLSNIPCLFAIDYDKVLVNKNAPHPNEMECLEELDVESNLLETEKLIAENRDAQLKIGIISVKHFESRKELDGIYLKSINQEAYSKQIDKISINKAFELLDVNVSCNMEYYSNNREELEKDLKRKVTNECELKEEKLEQELFYNLMCKWFGNESESSFDSISKSEIMNDKVYEKSYMLQEFCVHFSTNYYYATAQRENYYLIFEYVF
jgi:hypothetical protein